MSIVAIGSLGYRNGAGYPLGGWRGRRRSRSRGFAGVIGTTKATSTAIQIAANTAITRFAQGKPLLAVDDTIGPVSWNTINWLIGFDWWGLSEGDVLARVKDSNAYDKPRGPWWTKAQVQSAQSALGQSQSGKMDKALVDAISTGVPRFALKSATDVLALLGRPATSTATSTASAATRSAATSRSEVVAPRPIIAPSPPSESFFSKIMAYELFGLPAWAVALGGAALAGGAYYFLAAPKKRKPAAAMGFAGHRRWR